MNLCLRKLFLIPLLILFFFSPVQAEQTFPRLHCDGPRVVDPDGNTVRLRGVNLGNWLVLEMWMLSVNNEGIHSQYHMEEKLAQRFGEDEKERLMEIYRENWITERDFKMIADFGMNLVRIPFEWEILEDEKKFFTLKPNAWKWLDYTIEMAEKYGLYVILDMHGAPGRQSAMDHTGRSEHNKLWTEKVNQDRCVWLWKLIAKRYGERSSVVAFDFLNEPWGGSAEDLASFCYKLFDEIRPLAPETTVILPGYYSGIDMFGDPRLKGYDNYWFTMHFYPGFFGNGRPVKWTHKDFIENGLMDWRRKMINLGAPLLVGEFQVSLLSAGGGEMMRRYFDFYNDSGWPATMWSYKVFHALGGIGNGSWGMVVNKDPTPKVDFNTWSKEQIEEWFTSFSTMEYAVHENLKYWMTTKEAPEPLGDIPPPPPPVKVAPHKDTPPAPWKASDIGECITGGFKLTGRNGMDVWGGGGDIWGEEDHFRFISQKVNGDFVLTASLEELADVDGFTKGGLMIRDGLQPNAASVLINCFPSGGIETVYRKSPGGQSEASAMGTQVFPGIKLRLERTGSTVTVSYWDSELKSWTASKEINIPLKKEIYTGLAVCSHDNNQLAKASFRDITLELK